MNRSPVTARRRTAAALLAVIALGGCATLPAPGSVAVSRVPSTVEAPSPAATTPAVAEDSAAATPVAVGAPLPRQRLDPGQDAERSDLWARVRDGYRMADLDDEVVRKWEQFYASRPDYVQRMTQRGGRYLFHIVEEVSRRNLPMELALLPFIESAFNPQALSTASAAGMWQFMPGTGKDFELRQNLFRDDRRSVLASTRAALDYLQRLHQRFGDWHLALAAYNWGQGNVQRAIDRNTRAGLPTDYASLRMPDETRNYVPKLQAVKNIVARPEAFALVLAPLENHPFFVSVAVDQDIDAALVARLSGLTLEEFHQLNPQLNKPVILAAATPQVLLPYDHANRFVRELEEHQGPRASWTAWVAPRTLRPGEAARLVGMPERQLRDLNRIPDRMLVKVGSTLLVPRGDHSAGNVDERIADNAVIALAPEAPPLRRSTVKASRKGDTVASLARRTGMSAEQLARLNGVSIHARFAPGQVVKVLVPDRAKAQASRKGSRKAAVRTASLPARNRVR